MDAIDEVRKLNSLQLGLRGAAKVTSSYEEFHSPEYIFYGSVLQFRFTTIDKAKPEVFGDLPLRRTLYLKFEKKKSNSNTVAMKLTSKAMGITNKRFINDDGTWRIIYQNDSKYCPFQCDIFVEVDVMPKATAFASLHNDAKLADFELCGKDGSVFIHKAVLAASSEVLGNMLGSNWWESKEGRVVFSDTSQSTLQHIKDYLYLHVLPDRGLENLLVFGSSYTMPELEQLCVNKLVGGLTADNVMELLKFSIKYNINSLLLEILENVQSGMVKVNEIRKQLDKSKIVSEMWITNKFKIK